MGASGRVGSLLLQHWRSAPPIIPLRTQSRGERFDLKWSPIIDGPDPLCRFADRQGGLSGIIALSGATPSTRGNLSETALLADAVLSAAVKAGVPRVLFTSSSAVYALGENLSESDEPAPTSDYGQAKVDMESVVAQSAGTTLDACCLRIGNVAGADALLGRKSNTPVLLDRFPDGHGPRRSYIGPIQLAKVLERLMLHPARLPLVLNVAAEPPVRMSDLLQAAGLPWEWVPAPEERLKTQSITLDCTGLAKITGKASLAASPASMIAELRKLGALA
ncbi:NAD-dependent epimerase/dehydratase family protein [Litoreibacter arenae]|uniref:NAD-dependent epimerase/dehydratase n=1 Tax=Litoreibacter arenae DSM 19593 TaxID=1123360 RepID=S9QCU3_9RHOB|nr:NAD(P)-dependent oxidoreductase [Litoreibacter arenae]EPX77762.1 NAD-dependent epimerase/dehydratase [Litoreibacter arenae DSM 19593]